MLEPKPLSDVRLRWLKRFALSLSLLFLMIACSRTATLDSPTNFLATVEDGRVLLSWDEADDNTNYVLERALNETEYKELASLKVAFYIDADVTAGQVYSYRLHSVKTNAKSDKVELSAAVPLTTLQRPDNFTASYTQEAVELIWDDVKAASSYKLERRVNAGAFELLKTVQSTTFTDTEVLVGSNYEYRLVANSASASSEASLAFSDVCAPLSVEAERGTPYGAFIVSEDVPNGNASGGKYMHTPDGDKEGTPAEGDQSETPSLIHYVDYCFTIEDAGDYQLGVSVAGFDDSDNSYWVSVNGQAASLYDFSDIPHQKGPNPDPANPFPKFTQDYVNNKDFKNGISIDPLVYTLSKGTHRVRFSHRESDARLDKLTLELVTSK